MKRTASATLAAVAACALATAARAPGAGERVVPLRVTLSATVTKDWNTVTSSTEQGCPKTAHAVGRWTIRIRSMRPTRVAVRLGDRVSFSPSLVRFLSVSATRTGAVTTERRLPPDCQTRQAGRVKCARVRRARSGEIARFYRSRRNEVSFRRFGTPALRASGCPSESAQVRAIRPGLHLAQGEISERSFDPRGRSQTALGSFEQTTTLEGPETGRVIERVRWALTFEPVRQ